MIGHIPFPLVLVRWMDATADADWLDLDDIKADMDLMVVTIGWLVNENSIFISIASTLSTVENGKPLFTNIMYLPRCCIEKTVILLGKS